ncbi:hypothetical protein RIF29_39257 [Crotalaria pallida]|uniref:B-like cyclin n=1 Tax=Crotalaria pallida TaxID=3830 RepID=A0AAN9E689_CROPI
MASEAALQTMDMCFKFESNFMVADGFYSDPNNLIIRKLAISIIATHWKTDIDAFVSYLAMNYFDRFVSQSEKHYSLEDVEKVRLVALTCLFIAGKFRGISIDLYLVKNFLSDRISYY